MWGVGCGVGMRVAVGMGVGVGVMDHHLDPFLFSFWTAWARLFHDLQIRRDGGLRYLSDYIFVYFLWPNGI